MLIVLIILSLIIIFHNFQLHYFLSLFSASAIAGVVCAFMSLPFDNAKTKLQG